MAFSANQIALRADSPDAPSTHAEAVAAGQQWLDGEMKELDNHSRNESWKLVRRRDMPS